MEEDEDGAERLFEGLFIALTNKRQEIMETGAVSRNDLSTAAAAACASAPSCVCDERQLQTGYQRAFTAKQEL